MTTRITRPIAIAAGIVSTLLISCGAKKTSDTTSDLDAVTSARLWPKTNLVACWDHQRSFVNDAASEALALKLEPLISSAAMGAYNPGTTVISFLGFQDCQNVKNPDVKVFWEDRLNGFGGMASHIGSFNLSKTGLPQQVFAGVGRPAVALNLAFMTEFLKTSKPGISINEVAVELALHELGHIAGLFHEHAHPQSTCKATDETATKKFEYYGKDAVDTYIEHGTSYDPLSIMNYCKSLGYLLGKDQDPAVKAATLLPGLSVGDQQIFKKIYGRGGSTKPAPKQTNQPTPVPTTAPGGGLSIASCNYNADPAYSGCADFEGITAENRRQNKDSCLRQNGQWNDTALCTIKAGTLGCLMSLDGNGSRLALTNWYTGSAFTPDVVRGECPDLSLPGSSIRLITK